MDAVGQQRPCIVVAGMGRCGTSLMMQALDAMGVPCVGEWPDYETGASSMAGFDTRTFDELRDVAIKLIDPANLKIGWMPHHVVIWMKRDFREQARSQVKLLEVSGILYPGQRRVAVRKFAASLPGSQAKHQAALGMSRGTPSIAVEFEELLRQPSAALEPVLAFLVRHHWQGLDLAAGIGQVIRRSPKCFPGMMEIQMLARGRTVGAVA